MTPDRLPESPPFKSGDRVYVLHDPDYCLPGATGTVVCIGVDCMAGIGMVVDIDGLGPVKGNYEMFGRMQ